jgi:type II secretory pathway pseudopilin PulG
MVVVAIIAVLAMIVVPTFTKETKKSKAKSEVGAMFGELGIREDQYKTENGVYLEAEGCPTGTPASTTRAVDSCLVAGQPWDKLRVHTPSQKLYCTYEVTTNTSSTTTAPSWASFTAPATSWFFIVATCDMDSNGVTSQYFQSSMDKTIQLHNDGN